MFISKINVITDKLGLDKIIDETTWIHRGHGEDGSYLTDSIIGNPEIKNSGKIFMITDESSLHPREYIN